MPIVTAPWPALLCAPPPPPNTHTCTHTHRNTPLTATLTPQVISRALRNAQHRQDVARRSADVAVTTDPRRGVSQASAGTRRTHGRAPCARSTTTVARLPPTRAALRAGPLPARSSASVPSPPSFPPGLPPLQIERREKVKADAKAEAERAELLRLAGSK